MNNLKNFVKRHILAIALLGVFVLGLASTYPSTSNYLWFLPVALALLLYLLLWHRPYNTDWACSKCGEKEILGRHKFCAECGSIMYDMKKEKRLCPRGHRVEKHDRFCRKCGEFI